MALPSLSNWEATRDALHQIALIVGAVRVACVDPLPNDLHFSLDLTDSGFSTSTLCCGGVLEFDLTSRELRFSRCGAAVFQLSAQGHTQISLARALVAIFQDSGYSIAPSMKRITGSSALEIDVALSKDYLRALNRIYSALARFRARLGGFMTPLVLWPHHFDMGFIWFPGGGSDEHADPQISFGFAPFSDGLERPYIYAYAWSNATGYVQAPVSAPARTISAGYTGLYAAYDDLRDVGDFDLAVESMLLQFQRRASAQLR
ncbi:MAG: hypothetical protein F4X02_03040 [Chloroflexi bacterium]|nr:hypothetical protein [Chloroflexota bacterium]